MIENLLSEADDPQTKAALSFRTYMAQAQRLTTSNALFEQLQLYVDHPEQVTELGLLRMEREAEKLASADAASASSIKAAIAALRWDEQEVDYWINNSLRLSRTSFPLVNAAVSKGLIGDFRAGADYVLEAFQQEKSNPDFAIRACNALIFNARYDEAIKIARRFSNNSERFDDLLRQAESASESLQFIGIEQEEVQRQVEIGARVATEMHTRIRAVEAYAVHDFEDDPRFVVELNIQGDIKTELLLDEALVAKFLDDPKWDPMKLSVEFHYLTDDELQPK